MALLWIDGFDHYATADLLSVYDNVLSTPVINSTSGRFGGGGIEAPDGTSFSTAVEKSIPTSTTIVLGVAFNPGSIRNTSDTRFIRLLDGASSQTTLKINTSGTISVVRGASSVLATSTAVVPLNIYSYIEFKATVNSTTGSYEVRLNGVNILSGSGVNTQQTANAFYSAISVGNADSPGILLTWTYDDLYVLDTTGAAPNNDFLGDVRVDTIFPNAEGNYSQFTPSTGTDNSALVDEATPNGDTDYNSNSTATNKDSYAMTNLAAITTQTIYGVQTSMYMKKTDAGARSAKVGVRSSTTDNIGSAQALSTAYLYYHEIDELDPATAAAWTESGVNAMETLVETV